MHTRAPTPSTARFAVASAIVAFLGLYHGPIPLIARLLFGAEQRFAVALWLPAPWWWIACLAITVVALALLAVIEEAKQRQAPAPPPTTKLPPASDPDDDDDGSNAYDALSGLVFLLGLYLGVAPFIARLVFDRGLLLALPLHLPAPWWWITSLGAIVLAAVAFAAIDRAKQRRFPENERQQEDRP